MDVTEHVNQLAGAISDRLAAGQTRLIVGLAGAPGSGKSTLAQELVRILNLRKIGAVVVPMDGFHLDNRVLETLGLTTRKGSPESFDAGGFVHMIRRIKAAEHVYAPVFDRSRDIAIAGAQAVPADIAVIVCEGNYLLLQEEPWQELSELWDISAYLKVEEPELRARLIQRWLSHNFSRAVAVKRVEGNDLKNVARVLARRAEADFELRQERER